MGFNINHQAKYQIKDWDEILVDVTTFKEFESRVKKFAKKYSDQFPAPVQDKARNKYLGDSFEIFAEAIINAFNYDKRIGISDYLPIDPRKGEKDYGVDGYGIGINLHPATVQVKFKSNPTTQLTANQDNLSNFKNRSHEVHGVRFEDVNNMLIITNCRGINHKTKEEMLNGKVRELNRDMIVKLVDNVSPFWRDFRRAMP